MILACSACERAADHKLDFAFLEKREQLGKDFRYLHGFFFVRSVWAAFIWRPSSKCSMTIRTRLRRREAAKPTHHLVVCPLGCVHQVGSSHHVILAGNG
jgi:hypothetical protein